MPDHSKQKVLRKHGISRLVALGDAQMLQWAGKHKVSEEKGPLLK